MPAYKDEKTGKWYASFYYRDWTGKNKKKKKMGFALKKDAQQYEKDFLSQMAGTCDMKLSAFVELYYKDMDKRLRPSTMQTKKNIIDTKITPYFGERPINSIKAAEIRQWQNEMMEEEYLPTYLRTINNQFSAIFNYAVKFYDLGSNPCRKAGTMGSKKASTIDFWTLDEFKKFIPTIADKPRAQVGIEVLYWGGLRIGELLALTPADILRDRSALSISKTYQVLEGEDLVGPPKTPCSERVVQMPKSVLEKLDGYIKRLYKFPDHERIFQNCSKHFFAHEIERGSKASGVKRIRVHDLRHSHVSLLINLGYDPMMIAARIGHEDIKYVTETYGHLYPDKHTELVEKLENLEP